jgi:hypothetical protein
VPGLFEVIRWMRFGVKNVLVVVAQYAKAKNVKVIF